MLLRRVVGVAAVSIASIACGTAQSAPAPANDPVALLDAARAKNGLDSSDVKPWHIRGTYTLYDGDGKVSDSGVYEEWWAGPARYKRSFTGAKFSQVEFGTGSGLYRTGSQDWLENRLSFLEKELLQPIPEEQIIGEFTPVFEQNASSKMHMSCVSLTHEHNNDAVIVGLAFPTFCFQTDKPMLRISAQAGLQVLYDQMALFQQHYIARDVREVQGGKLWSELKLDIIEGLKEPIDSLLALPADAVAIDVTNGPIQLKKGQGGPVVLNKVPPAYPSAAKTMGISGEVVLRATVDSNGKVVSLEPVIGNPQLSTAAMTAVKQWLYRPFFVMGQPVEVQFPVEVHFNFAR